MNWMRGWRTAAIGGLLLLIVGAAATGVGSQPEDVSEVVAGHPVPPSSGDMQPNLLLGCGATPLTTMLANRSGGTGRASIILATARLTSTRAAEPSGGPPVYQKMILDSVRTLNGPHVPDDAVGWISLRSYYRAGVPLDRQLRYPDDLGSMWGPDGRMFAFYEWDAGAVGPKLITAPVVGDKVVFSQAGCWNVTGLPSQAYRGGVAQVPGSHTYDLVAQSSTGFQAVPLNVIVSLVTAAN